MQRGVAVVEQIGSHHEGLASATLFGRAAVEPDGPRSRQDDANRAAAKILGQRSQEPVNWQGESLRGILIRQEESRPAD